MNNNIYLIYIIKKIFGESNKFQYMNKDLKKIKYKKIKVKWEQ